MTIGLACFLLLTRFEVLYNNLCPLVSHAPVTLQAVRPAVSGFIGQQKRLQGRLISFEICCYHDTTGCITHCYRHWAERPCSITTIQGLYVTL